MIRQLCFLILAYFTLLWVCYTILFITSIPRIIRKFQEMKFSNVIKKLVYANGLDITVLMPVRNGEKFIGSAIDAVLNNEYPNVYLMIINDGSSDKTLRHLIHRYHLEPSTKSFRNFIKTSHIKKVFHSLSNPRLIVIDKAHEQNISSAADCLNAGLNLCHTPLLATIDADTIITKDTLTQLLYQYLTTPHCVAVGGDIFIPVQHKKIKKPLTQKISFNPTLGVQITEYLRSFIYGHEFWGDIGDALCHSGALTLLETKRVVELGGFDTDNFSYDAEIIMRIHDESLKNKFPYRIQYAPAAIAWSLQPPNISGLWEQRRRWQRGLLRSLALHKHMLFNPNYGRVGMLGMPFYVVFEIFGPVVEGISYLLLIAALWSHALIKEELFWFLMLAWAFLFILTVSSVLINFLTFNQYHRKSDLFKLLLMNLFDVVFYRPIRSFCALFSTLEYLFNRLRGKPL